MTTQMLAEWDQVPAYHAAAESVLGASGFELLARAFQDARASMAASAERLLSGWLARAGVTAAGGACSTAGR